MKATDLMVGDLVLLWGRTPARVDAIGDCLVYLYEPKYGDWKTTYEHIKPIPLTAEIIEKNTDGGFCDFRDPIIGYKGKRSLYWIGKVGIYVEWERMIGVPYVEFQGLGDTFFKGYIKSLHELQHALRLCGIDKQITI